MSSRDGWQKICQEAHLVPGTALEFEIAQDSEQPGSLPLSGFLFVHGGQPRAYLNRCPHLGIELNWMPGRFMDADNQFIQCSSHGALFLPASGECIAGPCQGDALTALEVRIVDGWVEVRLTE